jgi:hypothetical protein
MARQNYATLQAKINKEIEKSQKQPVSKNQWHQSIVTPLAEPPGLVAAKRLYGWSRPKKTANLANSF